MAKKIHAYIDAPIKEHHDLHTGGIAYVVHAPYVDEEVRCVTLVDHEGDKHEPVYTHSEVAQLVKTLRMAFNVVDELNAEGFGPLTSKEGLEAFSALVDALDVFDPA